MRIEFQDLVAALPPGISRATRHGLELEPTVEPEMRMRLLAQLTHFARASTGQRQTLTAWLGDLLVQGGRLRRGQISAYAAAAGLDAGTLSNAKLVCSRIPISCRHEALTWTHHCEAALAFADSAAIEEWLTLAKQEQLSARDLRLRIRQHIAGSSRSALTADSHPAFSLMRDLRSVARAIEKQNHIWRRWDPAAARQALQELQPIAGMIDRLRARAQSAVETGFDVQRN